MHGADVFSYLLQGVLRGKRVTDDDQIHKVGGIEGIFLRGLAQFKEVDAPLPGLLFGDGNGGTGVDKVSPPFQLADIEAPVK